MDSEEIKRRLELRAELLSEECNCEECSKECDDTCSSLDNPCKECYDLPEIIIPVEEKEEEVVVKTPARKRSTKKK